MHPTREILAVVPARGGSKGIPGKNLVPICGRPLLVWTLERCRQEPEISRTVVSTDDATIAAVAEANGAEVVWRPAEISGDTAPSELALLHVLETLELQDGYDPDLVVFLQATSPLRAPGTIGRAIAQLDREGADSLLSVGPIRGFVWRESAAGVESVTYDWRNRPRRQDVSEDLLENGSFYIFPPRLLRSSGNRLGGRISAFVMSYLESFQIDEPEDLPVMETLATIYRAGQTP